MIICFTFSSEVIYCVKKNNSKKRDENVLGDSVYCLKLEETSFYIEVQCKLTNDDTL